MTAMPTPAISVRVDPINPGQFFACCGLLEIADRLWDGAEGWFEGGEFHVACAGRLADLLQALVCDVPLEVTRLPSGLKVKPLIAPLDVSLGRSTTFTLDAWMAVGIEKRQVAAVAAPPWNFLSGQQTSLRVWKPLREALLKQIERGDQICSPGLFEQRVPLSGRFGFDPGAAWNTLDVGFSPNEQNLDVASSPAVELLAAVGIERFRPVLSTDRSAFIYATWGNPLSPPVAAAAASGAIRVEPAERYRGRVISRGNYAALGFSTWLKEG